RAARPPPRLRVGGPPPGKGPHLVPLLGPAFQGGAARRDRLAALALLGGPADGARLTRVVRAQGAERSESMRAVVMAGGEGTRLRPLTPNQPKPMGPIVGKPFMEHILQALRGPGLPEVRGPR